jgi:hypothetical protein
MIADFVFADTHSCLRHTAATPEVLWELLAVSQTQNKQLMNSFIFQHVECCVLVLPCISLASSGCL